MFEQLLASVTTKPTVNVSVAIVCVANVAFCFVAFRIYPFAPSSHAYFEYSSVLNAIFVPLQTASASAVMVGFGKANTVTSIFAVSLAQPLSVCLTKYC